MSSGLWVSFLAVQLSLACGSGLHDLIVKEPRFYNTSKQNKSQAAVIADDHDAWWLVSGGGW